MSKVRFPELHEIERPQSLSLGGEKLATLSSRVDSPFPDLISLLARLAEYRTIGEDLFLARYASGRKPKAHYFAYAGRQYPVKAVWAAAHKPPIHTRTFRTGEALAGLAALGFLVELQPVQRLGHRDRGHPAARLEPESPMTIHQERLQHRISRNGSGWYWEVANAEHEVIARGISDTLDQAREDAQKVSPSQNCTPKFAR
jgi:hypothetical protein